MYSRSNLTAFLLASRRWGSNCRRRYVTAHFTNAHRPPKKLLWTTSRVLMLAAATGASTFGVQHFVHDGSAQYLPGSGQMTPKYGTKRDMEKVSKPLPKRHQKK